MNKKYLLAVLAVVLVGFGGVLFSRAELFQGKFPTLKARPVTLYNWFGHFVSPVASPVPSIVLSDVSSNVPSSGGPSVVTSKVPSVVTSSVASPVAVSAEEAAKVDPKKIKKLTARVLEEFAKNDFKKNPRKYTLSWGEKEKLLQLYKMKK